MERPDSFYYPVSEEVLAQRLDDLGFTPEALADAIAQHRMDSSQDTPSVYCGTYAKYNDASLNGMWVDISTFDTYEEFTDFCRAIHADEEDPELMFQDFQEFPKRWYSESGLGSDDFDHIKEYVEMQERYDREALDAYLDYTCEPDLSRFEDRYVGEYDSEESYAMELVDECYNLKEMMGSLVYYFDYAAFARDLFSSDYTYEAGYVFRDC